MLTGTGGRHGVVERELRCEVDGEKLTGLVWRPEGATGPLPLVLVGHGGTQHKRAPNVLGLARRFVRRLGFAAAALDAPGHGDRVDDAAAAAAARRDLRRRLAAAPSSVGVQGGTVSSQASQAIEATDRAIAEWRAALDQMVSEGVTGGPVGYWGLSLGAMLGLPLVAAEPRISAAVLGLVGLGGLPGATRLARDAPSVNVPVLFVTQWDDQLVDRAGALALFDALGSADKALHAFPGGHLDTPMTERDSYDAFFARHLG